MVFEVARHGTTFATRPRAEELRDALLVELGADDRLVLDFTDVLAVSSSFADEFLGELAAVRPVQVTGASSEVDRVLARVLDRRGLVTSVS